MVQSPNDSVAVPLVHHTVPGTKKKSYSEIIQLPYHRMKGIGKIKRNDCVFLTGLLKNLEDRLIKKNIIY